MFYKFLTVVYWVLLKIAVIVEEEEEEEKLLNKNYDKVLLVETRKNW